MAARVRLLDIARAANVTAATASLALNGRLGVSKDTRARILQLARDMGYSPHHGARALARGRSGLWGAWVSGPEEIWSRWLSGVLTQASSRILISRMPSGERRRDMARLSATEGRLDGCLVFDPEGDDAGLQPLLEHGIPTVVAGRRSTWFDCVEISDLHAFSQFLSILGRDGRPVVLVATPLQAQRDDPRVRSWQSRAEAGRSATAPLLFAAEDSMEEGALVAQELLSRVPRPCSVVCIAGDRAAAGILRAIRAKGLAAPSDVAVAGWGDLPFGAWIEPSLSTASTPWEDAGVRSVLTLSSRFARPDLPKAHRALDSKVVIRGST
jgi:DNA-binding LacI/PurR family transcriptional regulator